MEKSKAAIILGLGQDDLNDLENITDAYEEEVFKITSFFLNRMFIPQLAEARIKRLESIQAAYDSLVESDSVEPKPVIEDVIISSTDLVGIVQSMQSWEMKVKLGLANSESASVAAFWLQKWIDLFNAYAPKFCEAYSDKEAAGELNIPARTQIEYGEMLTELKAGNKVGWALKEFARLQKMLN